MKLLIKFIIWIFGLACGLSLASWLIASERIGDAIVFVYLTNGFAVLAFVLLIYLSIRHSWRIRN
ncbi:hypothetical protein ACLBWZ_13310 [Brucellaceae bacterium C25G]